MLKIILKGLYPGQLGEKKKPFGTQRGKYSLSENFLFLVVMEPK
jgi:hypothetical protein